MFKLRCRMAGIGVLGSSLLIGLTLSGCSDDQTETGTLVEKPAAADAGEKASMEHMRAMMGKGGNTKTKPEGAATT